MKDITDEFWLDKKFDNSFIAGLEVQESLAKTSDPILKFSGFVRYEEAKNLADFELLNSSFYIKYVLPPDAEKVSLKVNVSLS